MKSPKQRKNLLNALGILSFCLLSSCTNLSSIDKPVCVEINMGKGYCTTIISGKGQIVDDQNLLNGKTWFEMRPEMVQVPVDTYAALKKYLIMNCKRSKNCDRNIDSWSRSINSIDGELVKKLGPELP